MNKKRLLLVAIATITCLGLQSLHAQAPQTSGLGDAGKLKSLAIDTGRENNADAIIAGRNGGQQLLVTGIYASGQEHDLTRQVKYEAAPEGVVKVSSTGYAVGLKEGDATIIAKSSDGQQAETKVTVTHIVNDLPINFANDVVPIFTRFGCNSGGCHGKSGGQNGFSLSLLGFEPQEDYEYLVKESRGGRRLLPVAPEYSLLLRKACGQMAHGGGKKIEVGSPAYRVMLRWIEQGMPYGQEDDPTVTRIEVSPKERIMANNATQQLAVIAHYSDGATRDVTRLAQFEANVKDLAEVSETGLVHTKELPGIVAVMARFLSHVDVCRITIPQDINVTNLPPAKSFVDELVFQQLDKLGLPPSKLCDDSTFLRRVTIDIAGRLPTLEETKQFLSDKSPKKRENLIDRLLASKDYAYYFGNKWSAVLRNKRSNPNEDSKATFAFHAWIVDSLHKNKPYDRFVREILTALGKEVDTPPVTWYKEVKGPEAQVEDVAQLFLGLRIQCAKCHHHPFEKWSQQDYYGFAAFFSQLKYKDPPKIKNKRKKKKKKKKGYRPLVEIVHQNGVAKAKHPRTGEDVLPAGLGGTPTEIPAKVDPRTKLADWMTDRENPYFAKVLVNRYWKHFLGRGLVEPEDDMRVTNPPTNPTLLDALAKHFVDSKYDLKKLIKTICMSNVYQLSAVPNEHNRADKQNFSRFYPRRLNAETLLDAIDQVTMSKTRFKGAPKGATAVQLPDNAFDSYFLSVFGRPSSSSACECERGSDLSLAQMLHLINSSSILQKVAGSRAETLSKSKGDHAKKLRELYLVALSRPPTDAELNLLTSYIEKRGSNVRDAYEDIIWAVINSQEFIFNH